MSSGLDIKVYGLVRFTSVLTNAARFFVYWADGWGDASWRAAVHGIRVVQGAGAQFTCFTGANVQMLTRQLAAEHAACQLHARRSEAAPR